MQKISEAILTFITTPIPDFFVVPVAVLGSAAAVFIAIYGYRIVLKLDRRYLKKISMKKPKKKRNHEKNRNFENPAY